MRYKGSFFNRIRDRECLPFEGPSFARSSEARTSRALTKICDEVSTSSAKRFVSKNRGMIEILNIEDDAGIRAQNRTAVSS